LNIPKITNISTAIRIYYSYPEIGNAEITELFGKRSPQTVSKLKEVVKNKMMEDGKPRFHPHRVNTTTAFEVWGLDISDLEHRQEKLKRLGLSA